MYLASYESGQTVTGRSAEPVPCVWPPLILSRRRRPRRGGGGGALSIRFDSATNPPPFFFLRAASPSRRTGSHGNDEEGRLASFLWSLSSPVPVIRPFLVSRPQLHLLYCRVRFLSLGSESALVSPLALSSGFHSEEEEEPLEMAPRDSASAFGGTNAGVGTCRGRRASECAVCTAAPRARCLVRRSIITVSCRLRTATATISACKRYRQTGTQSPSYQSK